LFPAPLLSFVSFVVKEFSTTKDTKEHEGGDNSKFPSYNGGVSRSFKHRQKPDGKPAQRLETLGLIIILILILTITITRSWHHINWSAR
jgi:hypothetical protein